MKKIFMIGDSLMQDYNAKSYPQFGFGQTIKPFVQDEVLLINLARNGRSTKRFYDEKRYEDLEFISKGDLLIISFGHNDEVKDNPVKYTDKDKDYLEYLMFYYKLAHDKGANVIFLTSCTRYSFENGKIIDTHLGYPQSMLEFCKNNGFFCIDMNDITKKYYDYFGEKKCVEFHQIYEKGIYKRYIDGLTDNTHYTYKGSMLVSMTIVDYLSKHYSKFNDYFISVDEAIDYNPNLYLHEFDEIKKLNLY